jgi:uncharacterized protein YecE (DUF72 family)
MDQEWFGMVNWYMGTMGFSYKDWSGPFYPKYIESRDYLDYYRRIFNAVEIDSTFYATPRAEVVTRWAEVASDGFKICAKLPNTITHDMKLLGVAEEFKEYLNVIRLLGDSLGVLLIQMPPSFSAHEKPALTGFLEILPGDVRFALEFRHPSWYSDETASLLERYNVAWAATEYEGLPRQIYKTTDWLYLRFIGKYGRFRSHESEKLDVTHDLEWWREHLMSNLHEITDVYGFFNNDYAGFGAATCNQFKEMLGLPVTPFTPPHQQTLF